MKIALGTLGFIASGLLASQASFAQFISPEQYGWSRGEPDTTYADWNVFSSLAGPNTPDAGSNFEFAAPGAPAANVTAVAPAGAITSTGNLYAGFGPMTVTATMPAPGKGDGFSTVFIMQIRSQGTELNPATLNVNGVAPTETTETFRQSLGGFGFLVETRYVFELPGSEAFYTVTFGSQADNFVVDRLAFDVGVFDAAPGCVADWNGDDGIDDLDISAFFVSFELGEADVNGDDGVDDLDITAFFLAFENGC